MNKLFWKFFLSILLTISLTLFVSMQFEKVMRRYQSSQNIQLTIEQLVDFRDELTDALEMENIDLVYQLLQENPKYNQQILIFDSFNNEILGREKFVLPLLEKHFNHRLTKEFIEQGIELSTTILSDFGNVFYVQIQPTMRYSPIFSPRTAGKFIRFFLFILFSGIVCFWLTKTLTKRIKQLQKMTHNFMAGDDVSKFSDINWGQDELGQLGYDFQKMVQQLEISQQQRKQILSDISHELRSPLARMQVALAIVHNKYPETEQHISRAEKDVERMNELITQIIQLQKLSLCSEENQKQTIDLIPLIKTIINDANYEYQHTNKSVELNTDQIKIPIYGNSIYGPPIYGNKELLYRAFENIIRNALSHTQVDTTVEVHIKRKNESYYIEIKDYGTGIADKDLENIFLPFVRLDSSRNRKTGGYGLGLSIAKAVIEQHNGKIYAQNNLMLSGLIISIVLPIKV